MFARQRCFRASGVARERALASEDVCPRRMSAHEGCLPAKDVCPRRTFCVHEMRLDTRCSSTPASLVCAHSPRAAEFQRVRRFSMWDSTWLNATPSSMIVMMPTYISGIWKLYCE